MYCTPGVEGILFDTLPVISIYGLVSKGDHNKVLTNFDALNEKPFKVILYEKENFILSTNQNGKIIGNKRGKERDISSYKVK